MRGTGGFSTSRTTRPSSSSATPKRWGSGTRASRISASGSEPAELVDELGDPVPDQVVAQVHDEAVLAQKVPGGEHGVGEAERRLLGDEGHRGAESRAVADRRPHLRAGLAGDDPDLGDAGGDHRLDPVEEDRLVGDGDQLLGAGVGDRPQPGARAPAEDQRLHLVTSVSPRRAAPPARRDPDRAAPPAADRIPGRADAMIRVHRDIEDVPTASTVPDTRLPAHRGGPAGPPSAQGGVDQTVGGSWNQPATSTMASMVPGRCRGRPPRLSPVADSWTITEVGGVLAGSMLRSLAIGLGDAGRVEGEEVKDVPAPP